MIGYKSVCLQPMAVPIFWCRFAIPLIKYIAKDLVRERLAVIRPRQLFRYPDFKILALRWSDMSIHWLIPELLESKIHKMGCRHQDLVDATDS